MTDASTQRLDAFTDAAFAFAVTLMVVGAGGAVDESLLVTSIASIPSFAIGFALIANFWWAHVRWRAVRGAGDWRSVLLTLLLVFVVLIYVVPLRAMASSLAAYIAGASDGFRGGFGMLFTVYGIGFTAMSILTALLYRDAHRNPGLVEAHRRATRGQTLIWSIMAITGALSTACAMIPSLQVLAPWLYATLPLTIGLFAARWNWGGRPA